MHQFRNFSSFKDPSWVWIHKINESDDNTDDEISCRSKKKSRVKNKSILEALNAKKDLIDLSDDPSDCEEEMQSENWKRKLFDSSSVDSEDKKNEGEKNDKIVTSW